MRSSVSILLLFSFLYVTVSKTIILAHYELNKKEITEKYCINKDKPTMHCCGKCMLKKKLAEQEEQQKYPAFPDIKTDIQLVHKVHKVFKVHQVPFTPVLRMAELSAQYEGTGVFHPPSC